MSVRLYYLQDIQDKFTDAYTAKLKLSIGIQQDGGIADWQKQGSKVA